jgi:hypothetical protein
VTAQHTPPTAYHPRGTDRTEAGEDGAIWIICSSPKGWVPRRGRAHTSSEYPGTAVRWETDLFEVVDAITHADGSVRYRLEPWPDRHAVRSITTYDAATEEARGQELAGRRRDIRRRWLAIFLSPLLGHVPGPVQKRMEGDFGAPAVAMTMASALPLLALGFVSVLFTLAAAYGSGFSGGVSSLTNAERSIPRLLPLPLAAYLVVESAIRLGSAFVQGRPIGSVPGTLLYEIWRIATGRPPVLPPAFAGVAATPDQVSRDRFRMLEPFLALLSPDEQERLEERFGLEPLRWGRATAIVLLVVGGSNVLVSLLRLAGGIGGLADFLWLLTGVGISAEQVLRLRQIRRRSPAGSVLGALVRPLARNLLTP